MKIDSPLSQKALLIKALESGLKLTKLQALSLIGTINLGARILEMRQTGYPVRTDMVEIPNTKKRVALYYLPEIACACDPFSNCRRCDFAIQNMVGLPNT